MTSMNRLARATALIAALVVAGSTPALAAQDGGSAATNLTISPYIEVSGIAAALDWSSTATYGGETRTWNLTGDNGTSSYFEITANTAGGYAFSLGIDDLDGATHGEVVPYTSHKMQLTKMRDGTDGSVVDLTGLVGLGQYTSYSPLAALTLIELWQCDGACVDNMPAAEGYQAKVQLTVPLGLAADTYTGSIEYEAATL